MAAFQKFNQYSVFYLFGPRAITSHEDAPRIKRVLPASVQLSRIDMIPVEVLPGHLAEALGLYISETLRSQKGLERRVG